MTAAIFRANGFRQAGVARITLQQNSPQCLFGHADAVFLGSEDLALNQSLCTRAACRQHRRIGQRVPCFQAINAGL